ncbi:MAG TPA: hypothetical protein VJ553_00585 [Candidatus Paceibacterota bacterium]|nr:hypothetical protein [Candidatus Paceibacterota bacterium]
MTQGQFTISDTAPTPIIPYGVTVTDSSLVTNIGANTIWLGNDSTVGITSGLPLNPGANKPWEAGQALYAVCAPGFGSTLQMIDNDGSTFDPTAISSALLIGGLATQIATAINLLGVPPVDQAALAYANIQNVALGVAWNSPIIDVSRYNSLSIGIYETNGAAGSCLVPREIYLWSFIDPLGAIANDGRRYAYMPSGGGLLVTPSANRGPYIQIGVAALGAGAANASVDMTIVGSMRMTGTQERVEMINVQAGGGFTNRTGDEGVWIAQGNMPIGTTSEFPVTYAGPATFGWEIGNVTTQAYVRILDQMAGFQIASMSFPVLAAAQRGFLPLLLPNRPIRVDFLNANAGVLLARFALTMDGSR